MYPSLCTLFFGYLLIYFLCMCPFYSFTLQGFFCFLLWSFIFGAKIWIQCLIFSSGLRIAAHQQDRLHWRQHHKWWAVKNVYDPNKATLLNIRNNLHILMTINKSWLIPPLGPALASWGDTNSQVDGLQWQVSLTAEYRLSWVLSLCFFPPLVFLPENSSAA